MKFRFSEERRMTPRRVASCRVAVLLTNIFFDSKKVAAVGVGIQGWLSSRAG